MLRRESHYNCPRRTAYPLPTPSPARGEGEGGGSSFARHELIAQGGVGEPTMVKEQLGFIGVGRMGGPMAGRLLDAGYPLMICDKDERAMAPLVARGAQRAASPAALASVAER